MPRLALPWAAALVFCTGSVGAFVAPSQPPLARGGAPRPSPRPRGGTHCAGLQAAAPFNVRLHAAAASFGVAGRSSSSSLADKLTNLFPAWVVSAALLGLLQPHTLAWFQGPLIEAALGATMVCMGSTLSLQDFRGVAPVNLLLGFFAQFSIMPAMACGSAKLFGLPPAFAAGLILVGCCPGGTASNLVTLIAGADVALSVAMTACSTAAAAIMTPLLASWLAGAVVPINGGALVATTLRVVLVPVALGMALKASSPAATQQLQAVAPLTCVGLVSLICGGIVAQNAGLLRGASAISAAGGGAGGGAWALLAAVALMHSGGFAFGYAAAWVCKQPPAVCRTVSIETGMQNSALGTVLALKALAGGGALTGAAAAVGALPATAVALPGAISATVHSVIGSALAGLWRYSDSLAATRAGEATKAT